jgi:thiosulfate/3-mercaptopyruvate sulfurtransferase
MAYANPDALVSTDWLAARLSAPDIRVVDGTYKMPGATPTAAQGYAAQHIPGAVFFDVDEIADTANPLPHMVPDAAKFAAKMRRLGLGDGNKIVVYDSFGLMSAARVWWMFRLFGHTDVAVLNGGLPKWLAEGRPVEGLTPASRERHFTARLNTLLVRDKEQVLSNIGSRREQLLDARSAARFEGTAPDPWPGRRAGHIPGSLNLDYTTLIDSGTKTVVDSEQLTALFTAAGVDLTRPVIASCGSGVTAGVLAFGLHLLGHRDISVYDGSWAEWGLPGDTPVETGPARG